MEDPIVKYFGLVDLSSTFFSSENMTWRQKTLYSLFGIIEMLLFDGAIIMKSTVYITTINFNLCIYFFWNFVYSSINVFDYVDDFFDDLIIWQLCLWSLRYYSNPLSTGLPGQCEIYLFYWILRTKTAVDCCSLLKEISLLFWWKEFRSNEAKIPQNFLNFRCTQVVGIVSAPNRMVATMNF